ncbi:FISUMP domain-containing protein [Serratia sp. DD3]|uniref:FISUMP domain-containing protein n=1 Tax=Serratia sp. DD3 TaxID=1410619 RepID=UPI0004D4B50A|nr:FISUMP domain-containing protein [Serratia sp. DD3]KEY59688.1 hypothetical protein SRDD_12630 [Serratia sp. DD3]
MKKVITFLTLCFIMIITGLASADDRVVINGVTWATRNVDEVGTFAQSPENAGKFYQWNRKKAWNTTDNKVTDWNDTDPEGTEWEKDNDPSPPGWRVPTMNEMMSLFDKEKVSYQQATQNGIDGTKFTDKENGNSIFLPAVGLRDSSFSTLHKVGSIGYYWSNTNNSLASKAAVCLMIAGNHSTLHALASSNALSIRPVVE